ncbi:hypothetical protein BDZ89DRAFT_950846, partial [Hymenopellis radicata]
DRPGCDDVVTKPKLNAHWSRCHADVDCLDCSQTFSNPGQFKAHTTCISEAEKYEKSVYKGPKTVRSHMLYYLGRHAQVS